MVKCGFGFQIELEPGFSLQPTTGLRLIKAVKPETVLVSIQFPERFLLAVTIQFDFDPDFDFGKMRRKAALNRAL